MIPQPPALAMLLHTVEHAGQGVAVTEGEALTDALTVGDTAEVVVTEGDAIDEDVADAVTDGEALFVAVAVAVGDTEAVAVTVDDDVDEGDNDGVAQGPAQASDRQSHVRGQPAMPQK